MIPLWVTKHALARFAERKGTGYELPTHGGSRDEIAQECEAAMNLGFRSWRTPYGIFILNPKKRTVVTMLARTGRRPKGKDRRHDKGILGVKI
jgi:hypothetical protein